MGTFRWYLLQYNSDLLGRTSSTRTSKQLEKKTKNRNVKTFKVSCVFDKNRLKGRDTFVARLKSGIQLPALLNYSSYRTQNTVRLLQQPAA